MILRINDNDDDDDEVGWPSCHQTGGASLSWHAPHSLFFQNYPDDDGGDDNDEDDEDDNPKHAITFLRESTNTLTILSNWGILPRNGLFSASYPHQKWAEEKRCLATENWRNKWLK